MSTTLPARESASGQHTVAAILDDANARAQRYLAGLDQRSVAPTASAIEGLGQFDHSLPIGPTPPGDVLALLDEVGSPGTMATAGSRFFGFVIGGSQPAALAASWIASAWDQNAGLNLISPTAAAIETVAERWLAEILHLPEGTAASFVTGCTMAHVTALSAARHAVLAKVGWDAEADGLFGAPPVTVVVGDECHTTLLKALGAIGFGRNRVVRVPVDGQGRMRADSLPVLEGPAIVCIQAGNVNTGAFDPAVEIGAWARDAGAWLHVDGAFGLWAAASPTTSHLVAGYADADSWATDGHKWLNVPYDSGIAFVRNRAHVVSAMSASAAYLPTDTDRRDPCHYTPELSRRARGIEVWAALLALGRDRLAELVERCCRHATRFADGLADAGYQILNDVVLNQVIVSFGEPETTNRVIAGIQAEGTCWCGGTVWQGRTAMRISVSSWATTDQDVEQSLAAMLKVAAEVTAGHSGDDYPA